MLLSWDLNCHRSEKGSFRILTGKAWTETTAILDSADDDDDSRDCHDAMLNLILETFRGKVARGPIIITTYECTSRKKQGDIWTD